MHWFAARLLTTQYYKKSVKITGSIVLDDLYVNDTSLSLNGENSYAPLLINKIGNMTEITIQNVSQKKHSRTTEQYYKGGQNYAATSLIGNVGSEKGQNISLIFSNIKLDASDVNSIFKMLLCLKAFSILTVQALLQYTTINGKKIGVQTQLAILSIM